jgi:2'-5' RNA ligase
MKIFAVYLRINLIIKPSWFDDVRSRYSSTSILHITLVQPRLVDDIKVPDIKNIVDNVIESTKFGAVDRKLNFVNPDMVEDEGKYLLMSYIEGNESIIRLQKNLIEKLRAFNSYCSDITREYELNFRPHLSIADQIDQDSRVEVLTLVNKDIKLEGEIKDLVIAVVNEQTVTESEDPMNWITLDLK